MPSRERLYALWGGVVSCLSITAGSFFMKFAQSDGGYPFSYTTIALCAELTKLIVVWAGVVSSGGWSQHIKSVAQVFKSPVALLTLSTPAALYSVSNLIYFEQIRLLTVIDYVVLRNLNILFTALFVALQGKSLTGVQNCAVLLLFTATLTYQTGDRSCDTENLFKSPVVGIVYSVAYSMISSAAAIATERAIKGYDYAVANAFLYSMGALFLMCSMWANEPGILSPSKFFEGYNIWAVLFIVNLTVGGFAVSAILRYSSSITKVYATAFTMVTSSIGTAILTPEDSRFCVNHYVGMAEIVISLYLYYGHRPIVSSEKKES